MTAAVSGETGDPAGGRGARASTPAGLAVGGPRAGAPSPEAHDPGRRGTDGRGADGRVPEGCDPSDAPRSWTDRRGTVHRERHPEVPGRDHPVPRVTGPLERAWVDTFDQEPEAGARSRAALVSVVLGRRNPLVTDVDEGRAGAARSDIGADTRDADGAAGRAECLYTWVVEAPGATTVLLWANALFDHRDVAASEFSRLEGSDLWTLTLRLPRAWRASYRIAVWDRDTPPPWRTAQGRRDIRLAALEAGAPDPRGGELIEPREGMAASVASGPDAPPDPWPTAAREGLRREARGGGFPHGQVHEMTFPAGPTYGEQRVWIYSPPGALPGPGSCVARDADPRTGPGADPHAVPDPDPTTCADGVPGMSPDADRTTGPGSVPGATGTTGTDRSGTPLLILFDGQVWARGLHLPELLDAAIGAGAVAPLHVAMVDSHESSRRWDELGVPTAQVDFVLDVLLPRLRATLPVDPQGASTLVSGQSFGGLAALWTVALGGGQVGRALAQSPSLWRFDLSDPLLGEPGWHNLRIRSGTFEGSMLDDARALGARLGGDPRLAGRDVDVCGVEGGHDWAWWRQDLLAALEEVLPPAPTQTLPEGSDHQDPGATTPRSATAEHRPDGTAPTDPT